MSQMLQRLNSLTLQRLTMPDYETFEHDVLVIGAGGAGLRAAIEASAAGVSRWTGLQVASGQSAHRDGGGRNRGGAGQRR